MAYPQVLGTPATGNGRTNNGTSHTVTLPSSIQDGDWVVIGFAMDGNSNSVFPPNGWTIMVQFSTGQGVSLHAFIKRCLASESGTTITVTSDISEQSSFVSFRVSGNAIPYYQTAGNSGSSTNSTFPANMFRSGNIASPQHLFILMRAGDSTTQVTAPSTDFTEVGQAVGGTNNAAIYVQKKEHTFGSTFEGYSPGALTVGTEQWGTGGFGFISPELAGHAIAHRGTFDDATSSAQGSWSWRYPNSTSGDKKVGTRFTGTGKTIKRLWIYYSGATGNDVVGEIMSVSGGAPNAVLATSDAIVFSNTILGLHEIVFSTPYTLVNGTDYFIMIRNRAANNATVQTWSNANNSVDYVQVQAGTYSEITDSPTLIAWEEVPLNNTENASATDSQTATLTQNRYPEPKGTFTKGTTASGTSHNITLPSGIQAGELLFIFTGAKNVAFNSVANGQWRHNSTGTGAAAGAIYYKVADGTESGATVTIPTGAAAAVAWVAMRVGDPNNVKKPQLLTWRRSGATGASSLDVAAFNTGNGAKDVNVILSFCLSGTGTVTSNPATYATLDTVTGASGEGGVHIVAQSSVQASWGTIDPGAATYNTALDSYMHGIVVKYYDNNIVQEPMQGNNGRTTTLQQWFSQKSLNDTNFGRGQAFKASGGAIKRVIAHILKENAAQTAGTIVCKIYAHSGTFGSTGVPTGTALATSDAINIADIPVAPNTFGYTCPVEFTFATPYQTTNNTNYVVTIEVSGNGTVYAVYAIDGYTSADEGNPSFYTGGAWTSETGEYQVELLSEGGLTGSNTENASATDSQTNTRSSSHINTENASSTDSQVNTRSSSHTNTENASATDSQTGGILSNVANTENASATESQTATVTSSRSNTENASATDNQTNTRSSSHTNTENASSTDSQVGARSSSHTNTENASATDSQTQALTIPVSNTENGSATDSQTKALTLNATNTENTAATESQTATVSSNQTNTENASAVDSQTKALTINVTNTENASASDNQVATAINLVSNTENTSATDSSEGIKVTAVANTENASAVDSQTQALTTPASNTENTSATDSQVSTQSSSQSNTENASATDSQIGDKGLDVTNTENASATDSQIQALTIPVSNTENVSATDSQTGLNVITGSNTENASAVESQTREYVGAGSNTENASSVESQIATVVRVADNTENASSVDSSLVTAIHLLTNTENATAIESQLGDTGITGFNTETASATEDEIVTVIYTPTNTENASATDSSTGTISTAKTNTETAAATDDQTSLIVKLASNTDNASATESQVATVSSAQANTDNASAGDSATVIAQMGVTHTENASVTENNLGSLFSPQSFIEAASATDSQDAEVSQFVIRAIDEAVSLGESILLRVSRVQQRDETETIIEDTLRRLGLMRAVSEVESISEIVALLKSMTLNAPEVEQISELITLLRGTKLTVDESETLVETLVIALTKIGYHTELENISETLNYLKQSKRLSSEIVTLGEVLLFSIALKRTSDETINTLESIITNLGYRNGTDEIVSVLESVITILGFNAAQIWDEVVTVAESVIVRKRNKVNPMAYNRAKDNTPHIKADDTTPAIKAKGSGG